MYGYKYKFNFYLSWKHVQFNQTILRKNVSVQCSGNIHFVKQGWYRLVYDKEYTCSNIKVTSLFHRGVQIPLSLDRGDL